MLIALARTVLLYLVVVAVMRVLGKRQIGELEPSELVITILVSELAAVPMQDPGLPMLAGLTPIAVLLALGILTSVWGARSPRVRQVLYGKPSIVIDGGRFVQSEIRRLRLSVDEITEELRLKGVADVESVRFAVVETNGQVSVLEDDGTGGPRHLPVSLICEGTVMERNLPLAGLDRKGLKALLAGQGIRGPEDVFYMYRTSGGAVRIIRTEKEAPR